MANYYLTHPPRAAVGARVVIGLSGNVQDTARLDMPILDLFGENDLAPVLQNAAQRAGAIKHIRGSGQIQVAGADHFFAGLEAELVRQVRQFLDSRLRR